MKPIKLIQAAQRAGIRIPGQTRENARARHAARSDAAAAGIASCQDAYVRLTGTDRDWELPPPPPDYPDHISTAKADELGMDSFDQFYLSRIENFFSVHGLPRRDIRKNRMYALILQHPHAVPDYGYSLDEEKIKKAPLGQLLYAASRPLVTKADSRNWLSICDHILTKHITEQVLCLAPENRDHLEIIFSDTNQDTSIFPATLNWKTFVRVYANPDRILAPSPSTIKEAERFRQDWQILGQADPQAGQAQSIDYLGATRALCGDTGKRHLMQRRERPSP